MAGNELHGFAMVSNALDTNPVHCRTLHLIGMDIIGMDSYPFIAGGLGKAGGVTLRQIHVRPVRSAEGQRAHGVALRLRGAGKRRRDDLLRTYFRRAINAQLSRIFHACPDRRLPNPVVRRPMPMTTAAGYPHRPTGNPRLSPSCCAADRGVASSPWSRSSPTTPAASTEPSGASSTGWCDGGGAYAPAGRAPHRGPLPGRPRQLRRQYGHHTPGHQRHHQGARVGGPRIAL